MQTSNRPRRIKLPFGANAGSGYIRSVPDSGAPTGQASYDQGFPPETFQPVASGGVPPSGQDVNGVLNDVSAAARWAAAGGMAMYDATFAAAVGGYPKYAQLASTQTGRIWQSTTENNMTDPDSAQASGWVAVTASFGTDANAVRFPGKIDQWGDVFYSSSGEAVVQVNLAFPFASTAYNIQLTPFINGPNNRADLWVQLIRSNITTGGFTVQYQGVSSQQPSLDGFTWRCIGAA